MTYKKSETQEAAKEGILLINKPPSCSSFSLINRLRKLTGIRKIGHAGTLDPFATGVMIYLVGKNYTRKSQDFLSQHKAYHATLALGTSTDSYDIEGSVTQKSDYIPTLDQIKEAINTHFNGTIQQVPPMYSAKKVKGKKLYELARQGKTIDREPCEVWVEVKILNYQYPQLELEVNCSKGCYIRSIAHDLGTILSCYAHLSKLTRTQSGNFTLSECLDGKKLNQEDFDPLPYLVQC